MASNFFLPILLLVSLNSHSLSSAISVDEEAAELPCVKELLPCRPFLHVSMPPSECCLPLLSAIQREVVCLCAVFSSEPILTALNLTQDEVLDLPRRCGGDLPELGKCNAAGSDEQIAPTPAKPSPPANGSSPSSARSGNIILTAGLFPFLFGGIASVAVLALV